MDVASSIYNDRMVSDVDETTKWDLEPVKACKVKGQETQVQLGAPPK